MLYSTASDFNGHNISFFSRLSIYDINESFSTSPTRRMPSLANPTSSHTRITTIFTPTLPSTLLNLSSTNQQRIDLLTHLRLLHLLHHRNRNQHRRSLWFRYFEGFRREITAFCRNLGIEVERKTRSKAIGGAGLKTKANDTTPALSPLAINQATLRLQHWLTSSLIPRWYTAFTTLASTPSFAPLSLTLLALFARILKLTGALDVWKEYTILQQEREEAEYAQEVEAVLEKFGGEWEGGVVEDGDVGERVERDVLRLDSIMAEEVKAQLQIPQVISAEKRTEKKNRPKNAIDALFAM